MILKIADMIKCGAYSDVFKPADDTLAYKLFINGKHPTNQRQGGFTPSEGDERRRRTFESECQAYERASGHYFLAKHIPQRFSRCVITDVVDSTRSIGERYMLDHCYAMEYIEGTEKKIGECLRCPDHIKKAVQSFRECGVC